jgi:hypothetical protein
MKGGEMHPPAEMRGEGGKKEILAAFALPNHEKDCHWDRRLPQVLF